MTVFNEVPSFAAPDYFVVYHSNDNMSSADQGPIAFYSHTELRNTKHFYDKELDSILDIINCLLHFPRYNFDLSELSPKDIKKITNIAQNIIFLPDYLFEEMLEKNYFNVRKRSILIIDDVIYGKISAHRNMKNKISFSFNQIKQANIKAIWNNLNDYNNGINDIIRYLPSPISEVLPLLHFADQIDRVDKEILELDVHNISEIAKYRWQQQGYLDAMQEISEMSEEERNSLNPTKRKHIFDRALSRATFPMTITIPGQPKMIDRLTSDQGLPPNEKEAIRLIGVHNAISNNGIHVSLGMLNDEFFRELKLLEQHCRGNINNRFIWKSLRKLGKLIAVQLGSEVINVLQRSSRINVFSDFPIGLAILPDTTAPLCCYKPISYKSITPLTRALQMEMTMAAPVILEQNNKILIIECLDENDHIRKASDDIWQVFLRSINKKHFNVIYEIAKSAKEFTSLVEKHSDTKILIISSHGVHDEKSNFTGIKIGEKDIWAPIGNNFKSPPIVLFSSCHVSPRGGGAVSIADLFIRNGALTVLGTLVPVEVEKNGLLMIRLFIYLSETIDGNYEFENLSEVWEFVVASNAINEIVVTTKALRSWAFKLRKDKTWPVQDFQLKQSKGRLRNTHIYSDSIKILREIADKDEVLPKLNNALREDSSFPESLFYQFIGSPENVLINPFNKRPN